MGCVRYPSVSVRSPGVCVARVTRPMARASTAKATLESCARAACIASAAAPARRTSRSQRIITGPSRPRSCQITSMTNAARENAGGTVTAGQTAIVAAPASELRATIALALPVVLVQIGMMFMGVVDTVMVGHVSARVLAAVALGNLYFFNAIVLANGTLMALDPVIAQAVGADDMEAVSRAVQRGIILAVGLSVVTALLMLPAHWLLVITRQQPEIIPDTTAYLQISIPGVLPFLVFVVFRQTLQALHRVAPIVWTIIGANLCNAGLNWVFVYGHLGSPALGAAGSALATLASRWLMGIALLVFAWPSLRPHLLPTRRDALLVTPLKRLLQLGVP